MKKSTKKEEEQTNQSLCYKTWAFSLSLLAPLTTFALHFAKVLQIKLQIVLKQDGIYAMTWIILP